MSYVEWEIHGPELSSCNCDYGCPCQFNALPTRGDCRAAVAGRIDNGFFGDVRLDGLRWAGLFSWPGPIHEGNGEALVVVDERADDEQRQALLKILSGQETEPGATIFNVFSTTFAKVHEPVFAEISFAADIEARRGSFAIDGLVDMEASPIKNPVTGDEHQARIVLPHGFEYLEAEQASGTVNAEGALPLQWDSRHCHMATLHLGTRGQVR